MCGGSSPIDDLFNITTNFIDGASEMVTHQKEIDAGRREVANNKKKNDELRAKRKNTSDTNVAKRKQVAARNAKRTRQKAKKDDGREGTILTGDASTKGTSTSTGDLAEAGKSILGI